jgi:hypothetical protein
VDNDRPCEVLLEVLRQFMSGRVCEGSFGQHVQPLFALVRVLKSGNLMSDHGIGLFTSVRVWRMPASYDLMSSSRCLASGWVTVVENSQRAFRLLVVETDISAAMLVKSMLREAGALVVGPAFTLRQAEHLAACCEVDGALLGAHLNGDDPPFSLATTLRERGIPFVLVTQHPLPGLEHVPTLQRPFNRAELRSALRKHFGFGKRDFTPEDATPSSETSSIPPQSG